MRARGEGGGMGRGAWVGAPICHAILPTSFLLMKSFNCFINWRGVFTGGRESFMRMERQL